MLLLLLYYLSANLETSQKISVVFLLFKNYFQILLINSRYKLDKTTIDYII